MVREPALHVAEKLEHLLPLAMSVLFSNSEDPMAATSVGQLRIIRQLVGGPKSPSRIAEVLNLTPGAVTQHVTRLKAAGLVTDEADSHDRRLKIVKLTADGKHKMDRRAILRSESAVRVLSRLSQETRERLVICLEEVIRVAQEAT